MGKLSLSYTSLATKVMPDMLGAIEKLEALERHNNNISIPSDFRYRSTLREYFSVISKIKKGYHEQYEYLKNCNHKIDKRMDEMNNSLQMISKVEINKRDNAL